MGVMDPSTLLTVDGLCKQVWPTILLHAPSSERNLGRKEFGALPGVQQNTFSKRAILSNIFAQNRALITIPMLRVKDLLMILLLQRTQRSMIKRRKRFFPNNPRS